ncbi:hypothetical protein AAG906_040790 [Vitis piasezkii]
MASLHFLLRPSSNPNPLALPSRSLPVRCANERQALFSRIAPVYDNVIGFDFSRKQLSVASLRQHLLSKACYKNIEWIEGDAIELPFSDCSFDAITMGYGLRNVFDRCKAMQEMFRVLKPGSLSRMTLFCSCESVEIRDLVKLVLLFDKVLSTVDKNWK